MDGWAGRAVWSDGFGSSLLALPEYALVQSVPLTCLSALSPASRDRGHSGSSFSMAVGLQSVGAGSLSLCPHLCVAVPSVSESQALLERMHSRSHPRPRACDLRAGHLPATSAGPSSGRSEGFTWALIWSRI